MNKTINTIKLVLIIILIQLIAIKISAYPPRDENDETVCVFCGGDGWVDYGDLPTIANTDINVVYINTHGNNNSRPDDFPYTGDLGGRELTRPYRCKFDKCGSNKEQKFSEKYNSTYTKFSSTAILGPIKCQKCHSLSSKAVAFGSKAITKRLNSTERCADCHTFKNYEGGSVPFDTVGNWSTQETNPQEMKNNIHDYAVSSHPYKVKIAGEYTAAIGGQKKLGKVSGFKNVMKCDDCHDPEQVSLPNHKKYTTRFRLRGGYSGPDYISTNINYKPGGKMWVDTTSFAKWLHDKNNGSVVTDSTSAPIGTLSDDDSTMPKIFKRYAMESMKGSTPRDGYKQDRAIAFYSNSFCLQCHDKYGRFGANKNAEFRTPDIATTWMDADGGHIVRQKGKYLKPGDRLPCTVCHDPHGSPDNPFILKNILSVNSTIKGGATGISPLIPRVFCQKCHRSYNDLGYLPYQSTVIKGGYASDDTTFVTRYNVSGIDGKLIDPILEGIIIPEAPYTVDQRAKRKFSRRAFESKRTVSQHGIANSISCIGAYDFARKAYYIPENGTIISAPVSQVQASQQGCHSTGHNPMKLTCEGCHKDEFDWAFFTQAGRPEYSRKQKLKASLWKNYLRHPVYVSINDKAVNKIDVDDEVKNWINKISQDNYYEFKQFLKRAGGMKIDGVDDVKKLPIGTIMGKWYNPPKMDGAGDVITCLSCHNDHYLRIQDTNKNRILDSDGNPVGPDSTQAYLRMDMPYICMTCHPKGLTWDENGSVGNKIREVSKRHGGFLDLDQNKTGKCNTCHSMHGRHNVDFDSSRSYDLHLGMYDVMFSPGFTEVYYNKLINDTTTNLAMASKTYDGQVIYRDIAGKLYSKNTDIDPNTGKNIPYAHLLHNKNQIITCGRCHGFTEGDGRDLWKMLGKPSDTTTGIGGKGFRWPPNILYKAPGDKLNEGANFNREDSYFNSKNWRLGTDTNFKSYRRSYAGGSEHAVDISDNQDEATQKIPGAPGYQMHLRCGYCHDPHGNDNYVQLRNRIPISEGSAESVKWTFNGNVNPGDNNTKDRYNRKPTDPGYSTDMVVSGDNKSNAGGSNAPQAGDWKKHKYETGIVDFCTSCHLTLDDGAIEYYGDTRKMTDPLVKDGKNYGRIGKDFIRHPTNISMRALINSIAYRGGDTTKVISNIINIFDVLALQGKCDVSKINSEKTAINDNKIGDIICLTCHYAHASDRPLLRKSYDSGINSCVNICHPYVKDKNMGAY